MTLRSTTWLALALLLALPPARAADEAPQIAVSGVCNCGELDRSGRFTIELSFTVVKATSRPCRVRVAIASGPDVLFTRDHNPPDPVVRWATGQVVRYEMPSLFPLNMQEKELAAVLDVYVGLFDVTAGEKLLPDGNGKVLDAMRCIGTMPAPTKRDGLSAADEAAVIARAEELLKAKDPRTAWDELEFSLRKSSDYAQKIRLRLAIEKLGHFEARPPTQMEEGVVAGRIQQEKHRYLREEAGRMHDAKQYRGAMKLLEELGGSLEENAKEAVVGAVGEAKRVQQDSDSIRQRLINDEVAKDQKTLDELEQVQAWRDREKLLEIAKELLARGKRGAAWEALRRAGDSGDEAIRDAAKTQRAELEAEMVKGITQEELDRIDAAKKHPAWGRLAWLASHRFIYIGPKKLVEGILRNRDATRRLDLAYVFQTDLFNRSPNPGGTRITVFLKELWDFGGGQAGGDFIDIGNAKPDEENYRVDTGLMYHELTHCVYTFPLGYPGFNEGIANFGACFSMDVLGQQADQLHSLRSNLEAFRKDYAGRDMDFWRIQKYGPSAGLFLHFIDRYGKKDGRYDWQLYREFFRAFNRTTIHDTRPRQTIRAIAYYLVKSFGDAAFDDLIAFRFPLEPSDREAIAHEIAAGDGNFPDWARAEAGFRNFPNSPANRDQLYFRLGALRAGPPGPVRELCEKQLGTLYDWMIAGPFLANTDASFTEVFPPETGEIDFAKRYECQGKHTAIWRSPDPDPTKIVSIAPDGWITLDYPYGANTSSYAYCRVHTDAACLARLHLRTDDHLTVWLNGVLQHKMNDIGHAGSAPANWRYERVPDQMAVPLDLAAGANILVIKVTNGHGKAGFIAALTLPDGRPMTGVKLDVTAPPPAAKLDKPKWKKVVEVRGKELSALETGVGTFEVDDRGKDKDILIGTDTKKRVAWRKYTVRPGFPKDSPSNLAWIPAGFTKKIEDFSLELDLVMDRPSLPKMTLTFDGEGGNDGLSGWTLVFSPEGGKDTIVVRLEKYDDEYFSSGRVTVPEAAKYTLVAPPPGNRLTLTLGGVVILDNVGVPRLDVAGAERIGFATWGPAIGIARVLIAR